MLLPRLGTARRLARTHLYFFVKQFQNTSSHEGQLQYLTYTLENAVLNLPQGQDKMVWLIDFTGWTLAHRSPFKTSRESISTVQNHYPERLSDAFMFNPPKIFDASFKVWPFFFVNVGLLYP